MITAETSIATLVAWRAFVAISILKNPISWLRPDLTAHLKCHHVPSMANSLVSFQMLRTYVLDYGQIVNGMIQWTIKYRFADMMRFLTVRIEQKTLWYFINNPENVDSFASCYLKKAFCTSICWISIFFWSFLSNIQNGGINASASGRRIISFTHTQNAWMFQHTNASSVRSPLRKRFSSKKPANTVDATSIRIATACSWTKRERARKCKPKWMFHHRVNTTINWHLHRHRTKRHLQMAKSNMNTLRKIIWVWVEVEVWCHQPKWKSNHNRAVLTVKMRSENEPAMNYCTRFIRNWTWAHRQNPIKPAPIKIAATQRLAILF